jgi:UDP-N-acetylglucosamine 4,6-dehydratase
VSIVNQEILIFGGTGSLGKALIRRLQPKNNLHIFSRDEAKHWTIKNQLKGIKNVSFYVGDIRDRGRVAEVCKQVNPSIIIIASALKQVDTCENVPIETIQTNVTGCENVIKSVLLGQAEGAKLHTVLLVSTDKACAPTNVYGMTKALAERIITSQRPSYSEVKFLAVRYGNVLESRGSIIPLFKYQIESSQPITVTHPDMTRFIMTLNQSIDLIEETIKHGKSGEIWIPKIPSMKIIDLASIFAEKYKGEVRLIGLRPGEKIHEDLVSQPESIRTTEQEKHFIISSPFGSVNSSNNLFNFSSNQTLLEIDKLEEYLNSFGIFDLKLKDFLGREIEEIGGSDFEVPVV